MDTGPKPLFLSAQTPEGLHDNERKQRYSKSTNNLNHISIIFSELYVTAFGTVTDQDVKHQQ